MTVVEQILQAVQGLDEPRQREVLAVDFDDESSVGAWRARLRARAGQRVAEAMARFRALGLVDDQGRIVERELPEDMRPGSKTSVAT